MKNAIVTIMLSGLLGLALTGCGGPYQAKSDPYALEQSDKVVLMDRKLSSWIRVNAADKKYTDDGRLIAYAEIRNNHSKPVVIQVQTVFKDADNLALGDATTWQTVIVPQNAVEYYQVPAMSQDARNFVIRVKRGGTAMKIDR